MSLQRAITLGATTLALTLGSLVAAPANAATLPTTSTVAAAGECSTIHDSWIVTVKPPAPGTYYIQSERDRLMQKAVSAGYDAAPLGNDSFVIREICYRTVLVIYRYDDSVASIEHDDILVHQ